MRFNEDEVHQENSRGQYVPAIPEPFFGIKKRCECGKTFWTIAAYRGHYALVHILFIEKPRAIPVRK